MEGMTEVCPFPPEWAELHQRLVRHALRRGLPEPPWPLVLSGWSYSNDVEKAERWQRMKQWAVEHGLEHWVLSVPKERMYRVWTLTTHEVGPLGGPLKLSWDLESKATIAKDRRRDVVALLQSAWDEVAGLELCNTTWPIELTGQKGRRLLVRASRASSPPWGGWTWRSEDEKERKAFTRFRSAINDLIAPHEIDHVVFDVTDDNPRA